jgi:hypothetical protein
MIMFTFLFCWAKAHIIAQPIPGLKAGAKEKPGLIIEEVNKSQWTEPSKGRGKGKTRADNRGGK